MHWEDTPSLHPGEDSLIGSNSERVHGPFINVGMGPLGTTYCSKATLDLLIRFAGGYTVEERKAVDEKLAMLEATIEGYEAQLQDAERLRESVAYTLEQGAVFDKRTGRATPRPIPGQTKVQI
jgi:hypothetical protein